MQTICKFVMKKVYFRTAIEEEFGIILRVEILNFEKIDLWPKIYLNPVEGQWPFWNVSEIVQPYRLYANDSPEGPLSNHGSRISGIVLRVQKISLLYPYLPYFAFQDFFKTEIIMIIMRIIIHINTLQ